MPVSLSCKILIWMGRYLDQLKFLYTAFWKLHNQSKEFDTFFILKYRKRIKFILFYLVFCFLAATPRYPWLSLCWTWTWLWWEPWRPHAEIFQGSVLDPLDPDFFWLDSDPQICERIGCLGYLLSKFFLTSSRTFLVGNIYFCRKIVY